MPNAAGSVPRPSLRIVEIYFLVTPVFFVVDLLWQAPVRVAGLASPEWRYVYYAVLVSFGILCRVKPRTAPFLGLSESTFNLLLLILSVLLPIWNATDQVLAGEAIAVGFTQAKLWNFVIVGTMLVLSFKRNERAIYELVTGSRKRPET